MLVTAIDPNLDVSQITPASIRELLNEYNYELLTKGWNGETWTDPDKEAAGDNPPAVLVPREDKADLAGYQQLLESAVMRLSWITELSQLQVATKLISLADVTSE